MCVLGVWPRTKPHRLMTSLKANIKPCNNRMNEIVTGGHEFKLCEEREIGDGAGIEIEVEDAVGVCDNGLEIDGVDEGFTHGDAGDGGKVEAVYGFPESDFFFFVFCVFDTGDIEGGMVGE